MRTGSDWIVRKLGNGNRVQERRCGQKRRMRKLRGRSVNVRVAIRFMEEISSCFKEGVMMICFMRFVAGFVRFVRLITGPRQEMMLRKGQMVLKTQPRMELGLRQWFHKIQGRRVISWLSFGGNHQIWNVVDGKLVEARRGRVYCSSRCAPRTGGGRILVEHRSGVIHQVVE